MRFAPVVVVGVGVALIGAGSCGAGGPKAQGQIAPSQRVEGPAAERIGGDLEAAVVFENGAYRFGDSMWIDTPLPAGYPAPTPPGAIELKRYPQVRRAEVAMGGASGWSSNRAFWPLFRHIQGRDIEMTSPVEMDYPAMDGREGAEGADAPPVMAFLYRTPELGETGEDGRVVVRDAPALTVVSLGFQGDYSARRAGRRMEELYAFLAAHPDWEAAGPPRVFHYNGPNVRPWNRWGEVQIPVTARQGEDEAPDPDARAATPPSA